MIKYLLKVLFFAWLFGIIQILFEEIKIFSYIEIYVIVLNIIFLQNLWYKETYFLLVISSVSIALLKGYNISTFVIANFTVLLFMSIGNFWLENSLIYIKYTALFIFNIMYFLIYLSIRDLSDGKLTWTYNFKFVLISSIISLGISLLINILSDINNKQYHFKIKS